MTGNEENFVKNVVNSSIDVISSINEIHEDIDKAVKTLEECLKQKNKIIIFGNGGSAADAQHIAAELISRFYKDRKSIPAIALTTDSSIITSIGNDYSFELIFSRQCEGLVNEGDVVIAISTSGNSKNVLDGIKVAKKKNAKIIGLLGNDGGEILLQTDIAIVVNSKSTPRVQEAHRVIYHIICEEIEKKIVEKEG